MVRMNSQTKIIVATATALAAIDIAVRLFLPARTVVVRGGTSDTLTARTLRLVDDSGNERAVLKLDENGEPGLLMFDRNGVERLQLDTFENTPSLILMDREEARRVYFGMNNATGDGLYEVKNGVGHWATLTTGMGSLMLSAEGGDAAQAEETTASEEVAPEPTEDSATAR